MMSKRESSRGLVSNIVNGKTLEEELRSGHWAAGSARQCRKWTRSVQSTCSAQVATVENVKMLADTLLDVWNWDMCRMLRVAKSQESKRERVDLD